MATNPTLLTTPIAENGTKNVIPAVQAAAGDGLLSQSTGFPAETSLPLGAGGKAPTREDFNGALYLLSNLAFYNQKGWFFQFDANQAYFETCVVRDATDGQLYEAINDVAAGGSVPSADNTNWKKFFPVGKVIGEIFPYAGTTQPPGALLCDGAAVSRTMYPDLFDEIGTTYGSGDGSTTFNLPNLVSKFIEGDLTSGTAKSAGLPNITGDITIGQNSSTILRQTDTLTSALFASQSANLKNIASLSTAGTALMQLEFDASRHSSIYGNSNTVQPPSLTMKYYIQAFTDSTDPALVDLTQIVQDLANKATRDLTNVTNVAYRRRPRKAFVLADLIAAVQTGNYNEYDICPGDYYVGTSGYTYIFAGDNPMKGTYTGYPITADHAGLIVDTHETCKWNDTNDTTGGYVGSKLHAYLVNTVLPKVKTDLGGVSHLYSHQKLYSNSINMTGYNRLGAASGCSNNWAWSADQYIAALSEVQVYGSIVWSSSGYDTGEADQQLEVFKRFKHTDIFGNEYPWLRDVVSSSYAAFAGNGGGADYNSVAGADYVAGLIAFH